MTARGRSASGRSGSAAPDATKAIDDDVLACIGEGHVAEPTKPSPDPRVIAWLRRNEGEIVVDLVILGEIRFGILLLRRGARRDRLERWFDDGVGRIHCVSWDAATGLRWAQLLAELRERGRARPIKDSMIAATALMHGFALATLNRRDFEPAHVGLVDPTA